MTSEPRSTTRASGSPTPLDGTELPIACSLDAAQLSERLSSISAIGRDALRGVDLTPRRASLRFSSTERTRRRLEAIIAAEADCCSFMQLTLGEDEHEDEGALTLTIEVPDGAEPVLSDLVDAFRS